MAKQSLIGRSEIQGLIIELRKQRVMLDSDLAALYGVSAKRLLEQVKRNKERFPVDFMFRLTSDEWKAQRSQFATFGQKPPYRRHLPYVFTRNGANMVSTIIKSPLAVQRSIQIMRAFSTLEEIMSKTRKILATSPEVLSKFSEHSRAIMHLFQKDKIKTKEIGKIKKVVSEMITMLQTMIFRLPS